MKVIHFSDTHLGFSAYRKVTGDGLNQREVDVYNSFKKVVDYILGAKPDLVIHSGDLFDTVRPSNRAIVEALKQVVRLSEAKIPTVIIAGNHSMPKQKVKGCIFEIFEHLEHVYPVYQDKYEAISIGDAKVHCIPHCLTEDSIKQSFKTIKLDKSAKFNILTTHVGVSGVKEFKMGEFNEQIIPQEYLNKKFDYIALGHYHKRIKITDNTYYSGSVERLSFNDLNLKKGFLEVELTDDGLKVKHVDLEVRELLDLGEIDCKSLDAVGITDNIKKVLSSDIKDKIIRLTLKNLKRSVYASIDFEELKKIANTATHFELNYELMKEELLKGKYGTSIGSLKDEFVGYVENEVKGNKKEILEKGLEYIQKAEEKDEE